MEVRAEEALVVAIRRIKKLDMKGMEGRIKKKSGDRTENISQDERLRMTYVRFRSLRSALAPII